MELIQTVVLGEEELEEAIITYINKHSKGDIAIKEISNICILNGTEETPILWTGLKMKIA